MRRARQSALWFLIAIVGMAVIGPMLPDAARRIAAVLTCVVLAGWFAWIGSLRIESRRYGRRGVRAIAWVAAAVALGCGVAFAAL